MSNNIRLYSVYYISADSSTCFGFWHPSSGARITVITASGTGQPDLLPSALVVELELVPTQHLNPTIYRYVINWTQSHRFGQLFNLIHDARAHECKTFDSTISAARPQARQPKNSCSIVDNGNTYISSLRDPDWHWFSPISVFNEYRRFCHGATPPRAWGWLFNSGSDVRNECSYTPTPSVHLRGMHKYKYTVLTKTVVYIFFIFNCASNLYLSLYNQLFAPFHYVFKFLTL